MPRRKKTDDASVPAVPSRPVGRPSSYTDEIADAICERMLEGESLVQICRDPAMPSRASVYRWQDVRPDFEAKCARAREGLAEARVQEIEDLANATTKENVDEMKVKISTKQWIAMKMAPRIYGDRSRTEVTGANGGAIQVKATTVDVRVLSTDMRDALKQALFAAKRVAEED
jgi:hypothetical protein